jgi:hypothetical protein
MSKFNAKEFILQTNADPETVNEAFFEKVFSLPTAERIAAGDALEKEFTSSLEEVKNAIRHYGDDDAGGCNVQEGAEILKEDLEDGINSESFTFNKDGRPVPYQEGIAMFQAAAQIAVNVRDLQGDKVSPLLKAYADAAEKLSDAEYDSPAVFLKPMIAVVDTFAQNPELVKPKANPLRRNKHTPPPAP